MDISTSTPVRVLLVTAVPAQAAPLAAAVHELDPAVEFVFGHDDLDDETLARVDVLLGWRLPHRLAGRLERLSWACSMAAGVDKLLPELPPAVPVSRVVDPEQALGMAQYTAAMVLRHARGLVRYERQQRERSWLRHPMPAAHDRVVVLGWGEVGREVGRQLAQLGFDVRGWRRRDGTALADVLRDAAIVVNALPLTPETSGLLDAAAFAAMPRGAYLVNIARGGHVVEADLVAAVRSGHLAGAALDVQHHEPLPPDDPLWDVPGITITPHIAAQPATATVAQQFVAGLRCWRRGEPLPNLVDRSRGY